MRRRSANHVPKPGVYGRAGRSSAMFASAHHHFSRRGLALAAVCATALALLMQGSAGEAALRIVG